jgi:hypothetical protein
MQEDVGLAGALFERWLGRGGQQSQRHFVEKVVHGKREYLCG